MLELSLKTGIDGQLLGDFYRWLEEGEADGNYSVEEVLNLYCGWLKENPLLLPRLLTYESTSQLLLAVFGANEFDADFIDELAEVLTMYLSGKPLKDLSLLLVEKQNDAHLTCTRKFVMRAIPELSYAFSVLAMVHVQYLTDKGWNSFDIPASIKNFATYLKEGVTSEAMLRFKTNRKLMRVECHNLFEG